MIRTTATAAAMLLASLGALVAAAPAAAQTSVYVSAFPQPDQQQVRGEWQRGDWHRDRRAPAITEVTPEHGSGVTERGRTRITARFHEQGSGVQSVTLRVDGRDVTSQARIDSDEVRYRDNLRPGRHVAEVIVRDRAGNVARRSWNFTVVDDRYPVGWSRW